MTSFQRLSYRRLIDVETTSCVYWEICRWSKLREFFHSLYSTSRSKTLLNKTVEHAHQTKFQNISAKKSLVQLVNTFSFPGICPNIKRRLFSRTFLGRLLLKLMYWNKSINIMITTNKYQEQPPTIIEKFPKRQLWGGSVLSKKLISYFDMNVLSRTVWILSQLTAFILKLQQKISVDKNLLYGKLP